MYIIAIPTNDSEIIVMIIHISYFKVILVLKKPSMLQLGCVKDGTSGAIMLHQGVHSDTLTWLAEKHRRLGHIRQF